MESIQSTFAWQKIRTMCVYQKSRRSNADFGMYNVFMDYLRNEAWVTYLCLCSRLPWVVQKLVEKLHWRKGGAAVCVLYSSSLLQSHSHTSHCPYRSYMSFWKGTAVTIKVVGDLGSFQWEYFESFHHKSFASFHRFPRSFCPQVASAAVGGDKWVHQCL